MVLLAPGLEGARVVVSRGALGLGDREASGESGWLGSTTLLCWEPSPAAIRCSHFSPTGVTGGETQQLLSECPGEPAESLQHFFGGLGTKPSFLPG